MKTAFFAGSFDPFTLGHKSIVDRALHLFDRIIIGIGMNSEKKGWMPLDARIEYIRRVFGNNPGVTIVSYEGLTIEAAKKHGAEFLLRGVRTTADFEYERQLADVNRALCGMESVLLYTLPEYASISSSIVRELHHHGVDVSQYLPLPLPANFNSATK